MWLSRSHLHIAPARAVQMVPWVALVLYTSALVWVFEGKKAIQYGMDSAGTPAEGEALVSMPTQIHVVLGGTLSFLMVFRTNTAYNKWAAARGAWGEVSSTIRALAGRLPWMLRQEAIIPGARSLHPLVAPLRSLVIGYALCDVAQPWTN